MERKEKMFKKLDILHSEIIEIVCNRANDYIDDLDMLDSDINSDIENEIFEDMDYEELKKYVENVENVLNVYKGIEEVQ